MRKFVYFGINAFIRTNSNTYMVTPTPPKLVLYADDDPDDIGLLEEAFKEHATNYELKSFSNAITLLEFVHLRPKDLPPPCLIILDINMPKMNGKDALRLLRSMEVYEKIPVILFSTSTLPHYASFARSYNALFISKPLGEKQMNNIIETFISHCDQGVKNNQTG